MIAPVDPVQIVHQYAVQVYWTVSSNLKDLARVVVAEISDEDRADARAIDPNKVKTKIAKVLNTRKKIAQSELDLIATRTNRHAIRQFQIQLKRKIGGVTLPQRLNNTSSVITTWLDGQVALVDGYTLKAAQKIQDLVIDAVTRGVPIKTLTESIANATNISKERAGFIAQDQVGTLNSLLRKEQALSLGVTRFVWRSLDDPQVRPVHRKAEGKIYRYASGHPTEGLPGTPIGCRCYDEPIIDDVLKTKGR